MAEPVDLVQTLSPLRHGLGDPTIRLSPGEALRAAHTPEGPATLHLRCRGTQVTAQGWGPGASWAVERVR